MDIQERKRLLKEKRDRETAVNSQKAPEDLALEQKKLKENIGKGKMKYNRGTGKLEPID
jgi:hypothetical protein